MCEPSILIVVVVARAGLFTVRQIREWATYVFIYLFIFTLRYVIAPFRYLSRPLISAALAPALALRLGHTVCVTDVERVCCVTAAEKSTSLLFCRRAALSVAALIC